MNLKDISTQELQKELQRREAKKLPPVPSGSPDWEPLREIIIAGTEKAASEQHQDEDFEHYVYEAAMEAVYGKDFWEWRNKQIW